MQPHLGIAGVNTRPLAAAALGIAGHWGSTLRPHVAELLRAPRALAPRRLGDIVAREGHRRACFLLDYTFVACPERRTKRMRYRSGREGLLTPTTRPLPLYLDSGAYRLARGTTERWASYQRYCEAIDLMQPTGAMAYDVVGDQEASRAGYERMLRDGYADVVIPVWQAGPSWVRGFPAATNGAIAARDPLLRAYCDRAPLVAIGGLAMGPCPRTQRAAYLGQLYRAFPQAHFWALGQASASVLDQLHSAGMLDRIWCDGTWWVHSACTEVLAYVENGHLRVLDLSKKNAHLPLTLVELMKCNLHALLAAYMGLSTFPAPSPVPLAVEDPEACAELKRRIAPLQLDLGLDLALV